MEYPKHVAVIMDGNGRWARRQGLPRTEGHSKGIRVADDLAHWSADRGIRYVTLYTFSTENWKRPKEEIRFLFSIMVDYLRERLPEMVKEGLRMRFIGRRDQLGRELTQFCDYIEESTSKGERLDLLIALNYGGRTEIVDALRKIAKTGADPEKIDEQAIASNLYTRDVPDPDLIIRTSGEHRMSNFLLWQSAYSEFYFTETLWPDFNENEFQSILEDYSARQRRFGSISEEENPEQH